MVGEEDWEECWDEGKQRKLDVSNPKVGLGALEDHLEINTCKPRREACCSHSTKSFQRAHDVDMDRCSLVSTADWNVHRLVGGTAGCSGLDLNDADSEGEETKCYPFRRRKGLA